MPDITIPEGKRLKISIGNVPINPTNPMILEDDITISLNSNFSPLLGGGGILQKSLTFVGLFAKDLGITEGFSGRHKAMGYQMWENTDPIMVSGITVAFYVDPMNVHAFTQVYLPILRLMRLPLPGEVEGYGILIPPGASILSLIKGTYSINQISVEIGKVLRIENALIKKAEPTFSNDVDSLGYPIWGKISLDIQSMETATKTNVTDLPLGI